MKHCFHFCPVCVRILFLYVSLLHRMHVILNGEPLEEVDCFKYLGSQVTANGGCERDVVHRMKRAIELGER